MVLAALQGNELKLRALGYDTAGRLLSVFIASSMIAALAGSLYAGVSGFVAPDLVGLLLSTQTIVWVAVGGRGTLFGPILGAFFVTRLQTEISSISYALWPLIMGVFFVALDPIRAGAKRGRISAPRVPHAMTASRPKQDQCELQPATPVSSHRHIPFFATPRKPGIFLCLLSV